MFGDFGGIVYFFCHIQQISGIPNIQVGIYVAAQSVEGGDCFNGIAPKIKIGKLIFDCEDYLLLAARSVKIAGRITRYRVI